MECPLLNAPTTITLKLGVRTKKRLEKVARGLRQDEAALATGALKAYLDRELDIMAAIQRGLDDVHAGRTTPHVEAMRRIDATLAKIARDQSSKRRVGRK
jgi:predicted transcriptional regulator